MRSMSRSNSVSFTCRDDEFNIEMLPVKVNKTLKGYSCVQLTLKVILKSYSFLHKFLSEKPPTSNVPRALKAMRYKGNMLQTFALGIEPGTRLWQLSSHSVHSILFIALQCKALTTHKL